MDRAEDILNEMLAQTKAVIEKVANQLPKDFPNKISQPIFEGLRLASKKLEA